MAPTPLGAVAMITRIERNLEKNSSNVFCVPIAPVNRYRHALALLYETQVDAKPVPQKSSGNPTGQTSDNTGFAPGRRQTRTKGMQ